jgi:hypothetical protein
MQYQAFVLDMFSCLLAHTTNFCGLRENDQVMCSVYSSLTECLPALLPDSLLDITIQKINIDIFTSVENKIIIYEIWW